MTMLVVDNLVAGHGLLTAVRNVSFSVEPGEVLGVIGANGAGKTTLFRTLAGVHAATSGSIALDGTDVTASPWCPRGAGCLSI
jgi:branched-chain amino acid transport system ATP-binding protein